MKTFATLFAATAFLASASTATLAQVSAGGGVDAGGSVSVDAGNNSVDAGATGKANANANSNAGGNAGGASSGNSTGAAKADANSNSSGEQQLNYGSIISDLRTSSITSADIEALGDDVEINVVSLSELRGNAGENASALSEAVSAQDAALADLQATIDGDAALSASIEAALQAEGDFSMEDVVAITTAADGNLTLIVDDSE